MNAPVSRRAPTPPSPNAAGPLLAWYDRHRRTLPWRYAPGEPADPYRVWLSEIMLQQTTVAAVKAYFERFTARWPTVADLAAAPLDEVLREWAGLGYYSRARNLHAAAEMVVRDFGGAFPPTEAALATLPGVGPYTAAAIAAIAFGAKASPVDGNIERVVARLFAIETPLPAAKPELKRLAATLTPDTRAGDFAQAMMDLGATICTPRNPTCALCPLNDRCLAQANGIAADLPRRAPKAARPERFGAAFVLTNGQGDVLLRRRPPKGLLGGMPEFPTTPWTGDRLADPLSYAPVKAAWRHCGAIEHVFTHFKLTLDVYAARMTRVSGIEGIWIEGRALGDAGLPSVMRKVQLKAARPAPF